MATIQERKRSKVSQFPNAVTRSWKCFQDYGGIELFCRFLHRLRILSANHTFNIFYGEFHPFLGVGEKGREQTVKIREKSFTIREIFLEEVGKLRYADNFHYKDEKIPVVEDIREQFRRGLRFFALFDKDVVASLNGVHPEVADLIYVNKPRVRLPKGIVYFNAALTAPQYRSLGIGTALRRYTFGAMQLEGYIGAVSATFLENRGAARWHLANGFQPWGSVRYLRMFGRDLCWTQLRNTGWRYPELLSNGKSNGSAQATRRNR